MSDADEFIVAAEPALPWKAGEFSQAYLAMRDTGLLAALEANPVAVALMAYLEGEETYGPGVGLYNGYVSNLARECRLHSDAKYTKAWPQSSQAFGTALRRAAPGLRHAGWEIDYPPRDKQGQRVRIYKVGTDPDAMPAKAKRFSAFG